MEAQNKKLPIVSIVGRTNVGKSTLFNRLVKNKAIISRIPGTTRDANYQEAQWQGFNFMLVDTGGLEDEICKDLDKTKITGIDKEILKKTKNAILNSDLILFLVDAKTGLMPQDREFSKYIKKNKLNTILVSNKNHTKSDRTQGLEFFQLGLGSPTNIAAASGSGVGDLLDLLLKKLKTKIKRTKKEKVDDSIKITFVGKTNVGKSSLINAILNENRVIVSEQEHTTRDAQYIPFEYKEKKFVLIDTAGMRKKRMQTQKNELESKSVVQTKKAIHQTDIIILVTDVSQDLTVGDMKFAEIIKEEKKGLIIIANKWDKIEDKDIKSYKKYVDYYNTMMPYLSWARVIPISALTKQRIFSILDDSIEIYQKALTEISREKLKDFLYKITKIHPPTIGRGSHKPKIHSIKNVGFNPLAFEVVIGAKTSLHDSYLKFIEKKLRQDFSLQGVPIVVYIKKSRTVVR